MNHKTIIDLKEYRRSLAADAEWVRIKIQEAATPNARAYWGKVRRQWIIIDCALETVIEATDWVDALKSCRLEEIQLRKHGHSQEMIDDYLG